MVAESGKQNIDLRQSGLRRLLEDDHLFVHFFQAVRLLERLYPERNPVGLYVTPSSEVVRFSSLPIPASARSRVCSHCLLSGRRLAKETSWPSGMQRGGRACWENALPPRCISPSPISKE